MREMIGPTPAILNGYHQAKIITNKVALLVAAFPAAATATAAKAAVLRLAGLKIVSLGCQVAQIGQKMLKYSPKTRILCWC